MWDPTQAGGSPAGVSQEVVEELLALRSEMAELAERVDFTERLLARPRAEEDGPSPRSRPGEW